MAADGINSVQKAHAEAYKAYLRALKENLAQIDVEAVDASGTAALPPIVNTFFSYHTYFTYYTYHTYSTASTLATQATLSTESSIE